MNFIEDVFNGDSEDKKDLIDGYEGKCHSGREADQASQGSLKMQVLFRKQRFSTDKCRVHTRPHRAWSDGVYNDAQPQSLDELGRSWAFTLLVQGIEHQLCRPLKRGVVQASLPQVS